jgi:hypothetical protein
MKRVLWFGLVVWLLVVGCGGRPAPGLDAYVLTRDDLPQGFRRTVVERSVQYLQLLIPEQARPGLVDGRAVGFESDGRAAAIRSLMFAYEDEQKAAAAFNTLLPGEPVQALPELGPEVYLHETAGPQEEILVTFRKGRVVGSVSVYSESEAMRSPRDLAVELARLMLARMAD